MPEKRERRRAAWGPILGTLRRDRGTLHEQLIRAFTDAIDSGRVADGLRVPSGRELATMLNVGRHTATAAITELVERGYLVSRERSGVFVAKRPVLKRQQQQALRAARAPDWPTRMIMISDALPQPLIATLSGEANISFLFGHFDAALFPVGQWRECERAASGVLEIADWGRDMVSGDDPALIESLRKHVLPQSNVWAEPDEIIITLGGQEARYLAVSLLCRPGVCVGVEEPGLPDLIKTVKLTGATLQPLPLDQDGLVLTDDLARCDVVYTTCTHQIPTNSVMPEKRRIEFLERASNDDFIIIEDTYETEMLRSENIASLFGTDNSRRVIHLGSLSKLLAPGLRLGYIVAPATVIRQMRELRRLIHRHPPGNNQRALAIFIERGYHRSFIQRVGRELQLRSDVLQAALARWLPDFTWVHQDSASTFWVELPVGLDAFELAKAAAMLGVLIEPANRFFSFTSPQPAHHLRLAVSSVSPQQIENGVRILAQARQGLER